MIDMLPDLGVQQWNILSVIATIAMLAYGCYRLYRKSNPFSLVKLPYILAGAFFGYVVFKETLDLLPKIIYVITRENPMAYFVQVYSDYYFVWGAIIVSWIYILYLHKRDVNFKALALTFGVTLGVMIYSVFLFGVTNMRMLPMEERIIFYWVSFVPMWIVWFYGYLRFWKK